MDEPGRRPRATRVITWNILHGGRDPDAANVDQVAEVIAAARPDVLVLVETYGSGELITRALNAAATPGIHYSGHRITQAQPGGDNLWIVHRFELVQAFLDPPASRRFISEASASATTRTPSSTSSRAG